jgi:hypothetical protein
LLKRRADGSTATIYMAHNNGILYASREGQEGTFDERFARFYLDPQGDGAAYTLARQDASMSKSLAPVSPTGGLTPPG